MNNFPAGVIGRKERSMATGSKHELYRDTETGRIFKKVRAGTGRFSGMFLWQPMKKVLFFYVSDKSLSPFWLDDCGFVKVEDVNKASAVEVEPVIHGRWIFDFSLDGSNFYNCSVCGRQEVLPTKESTAEYFPYCHCGAKMDQE